MDRFPLTVRSDNHVIGVLVRMKSLRSLSTLLWCESARPLQCLIIMEMQVKSASFQKQIFCIIRLLFCHNLSEPLPQSCDVTVQPTANTVCAKSP
jgi:hypothetical protein